MSAVECGDLSNSESWRERIVKSILPIQLCQFILCPGSGDIVIEGTFSDLDLFALCCTFDHVGGGGDFTLHFWNVEIMSSTDLFPSSEPVCLLPLSCIPYSSQGLIVRFRAVIRVAEDFGMTLCMINSFEL